MKPLYSFLLLCLLTAAAAGQEDGARLHISERLGYVIERHEAAYFRLFPEIEGFDSVRVYARGADSIRMQVFWRDQDEETGASVNREQSSILPALFLSGLCAYTDYYERVLLEDSLTAQWEAGFETMQCAYPSSASLPPNEKVTVETKSGMEVEGYALTADSSGLLLRPYYTNAVILAVSLHKTDTWKQHHISLASSSFPVFCFSIPAQDIQAIDIEGMSGFTKGLLVGMGFTVGSFTVSFLLGNLSREKGPGIEVIPLGLILYGAIGGVIGSIFWDSRSYNYDSVWTDYTQDVLKFQSYARGGGTLPPEIYRQMHGIENR